MSNQLKKILLLEDSQAEARLLLEIFREIDTSAYTIEHVLTLKEAISRLNEGDIDLLLSDLTLPDSIGINTYVSISSKFRDLPIIILTNLQDPSIAEKLIEVGAQDYIAKNEITEASLQTAIKNALARTSVLSPKLDTTKITDMIEVNLESYKLSPNLFHNKPLSSIMPDIFNDFCELYRSILANSKSYDTKKIQEQVGYKFKAHNEAFLMLKLSPFDLKEIHDQALSSSNLEFRTSYNKILYESILELYNIYSTQVA